MTRISTILLLQSCLLLFSLPVPSLQAQQTPRLKQRFRCKVKAPRNQPEQRRVEVQHLMLSGKCGHAGAAESMEIGNISSVPALLRVLRDNPPVERTNGRRVITSTAALAIGALKKVTGLNVGLSYEEWNQWWQESRQYYEK